MRSLINEGNGFAEKTGLAAGSYYETDQYVEGSVKVVENTAVGNPYASEQDVEKMGYGDIAKSGAYGGNVDYSKDSFDEALANSEQGWKDAGRDVLTSHTISVVNYQGRVLFSDVQTGFVNPMAFKTFKLMRTN